MLLSRCAIAVFVGFKHYSGHLGVLSKGVLYECTKIFHLQISLTNASNPLPRTLQLCGGHESYEKRFLDQAARAGKEAELRHMKKHDPARYVSLFKKFCEMCLIRIFVELSWT